MTEEEAKTKWCPFARIVAQEDDEILAHQAAFNRVAYRGHVQDVSTTRCIASACMAWRWRDSPYATRQIESGGEKIAEGKWKHWDIKETVPAAERSGHCGLAGAVQ
jgi:hypothetical protein